MESTEGDGAEAMQRVMDLAAANSGPRALFCPIRGGERCMGAACAWAARQGGRWVCGPAASAAALARTVSRCGEARAGGR